MKSIFIKLLIALPLIYLALFTGLWSSVTDSRPVLSILDMMRSDSATEIIDFSSDEVKSSKPKPKPNNDRNPYYGDLHVHTKHSFDAYIFGVTATPNDAYRYAKGDGIMHPMGYEMKLQEPLDFYSVTDHGFFMGMLNAWSDTTTDISQKDFAKPFHDLNRIENLTSESAGPRSALFSEILGGTVTQTYSDLSPNVLKAWLTKILKLL